MPRVGAVLQWLGDRLVCPDGWARVDAVVVLGGAPRYRAPTAARVLQRGEAARVVAVGGDAGVLDEVWRTAAVLRGLGVPESKLVLLARAAPGTAEEARVAVDWAAAEGLTSLGVVTSGYHTRRAGFLFRRLARRRGIQVRMVVAEDDPFAVEQWWADTRSRRLVLAEYGKAAWWSVAGRQR